MQARTSTALLKSFIRNKATQRLLHPSMISQSFSDTREISPRQDIHSYGLADRWNEPLKVHNKQLEEKLRDSRELLSFLLQVDKKQVDDKTAEQMESHLKERAHEIEQLKSNNKQLEEKLHESRRYLSFFLQSNRVKESVLEKIGNHLEEDQSYQKQQHNLLIKKLEKEIQEAQEKIDHLNLKLEKETLSACRSQIMEEVLKIFKPALANWVELVRLKRMDPNFKESLLIPELQEVLNKRVR